MKLLLFTLLALCVLGAVVAEPQSTTTSTPAASTTPMTHQPNMETHMEADPIYQEYIKKARELYVQALTDYYHAHPDRLEPDLSGLTSMEYENMVPPELLDAFHVDKAKIEAKIRENDARAMDEMDEQETAAEPEEAEHDQDMQTMATEDTEDEATEMDTQQFRGGRFGRFGGRGFGRGFGWGYGGWGWGYPYYGYGGWGYPYGGYWGRGWGRWGWGGRFGRHGRH